MQQEQLLLSNDFSKDCFIIKICPCLAVHEYTSDVCGPVKDKTSS